MAGKATMVWKKYLAISSAVTGLASNFVGLPARAAESAAETVAAPSDLGVKLAEDDAARAFDAYQSQRYAEAIRLYEQALAAADSADILYNIARVYDLGLADHPHALEYYRRYIAHAGADPSRTRRARERITELQAADGVAAVASEDSRAVASAAGSEPISPLPVRAAPSPSEGWSTREVVAASLAGAGLVGLGLGAGFGWSAASSTDSWRHDCTGNECVSQRSVDAARSAREKANVATVALTSGGGLLAVGAVLWWVGTGKEPALERAGLELTPLGGPSDLGCSVSGRF
jgi:tetratricopeptide (TPR) repeat protein